MKKVLTLIIILTFSTKPSFSSPSDFGWEDKACSDLFKSIGLFTHLSAKQWDDKNEKKAAFYSSVAANYAVIFEAVCKSD